VSFLASSFDFAPPEVPTDFLLNLATLSISLFLQMCGRGSRVTESKKDFTILDFGNNVQRHGFWEQERQWLLKKKKKIEGVAPVKDCPECFAIIPARVMECPECNYIFQKSEREEEEELIVELSKLSYQQVKDEVKTADFKRLEQIATAKGYKKTWIYHNLKTEKDLIDYASYKGYHKKWVDYQLEQREKNAIRN